MKICVDFISGEDSFEYTSAIIPRIGEMMGHTRSNETRRVSNIEHAISKSEVGFELSCVYITLR